LVAVDFVVPETYLDIHHMKLFFSTLKEERWCYSDLCHDETCYTDSEYHGTL